jgi:hypothetical protein
VQDQQATKKKGKRLVADNKNISQTMREQVNPKP